ncbi:MAG: polysaccharide deacetylase family protein [Candidatus Melainabacteria bacterium]|nr:polysaccharide deacetylase family protein [Candidatus Melainabacteria bacterium]
MIAIMLHHIKPHPPTNPTEFLYSLTPEGLRSLIRAIRFWGLEIVSLRDVLNSPEGAPKPGQVILTVDDGYENFYQYALPILEEEMAPATVFVLPGLWGGDNYWDKAHLPPSQRDKLMTAEQMERLCQSGWVTLGSHGLYHRHFAELSAEDLQAELHDSYALLSQRLPDAFLPALAYPFGSYSPAVLQALAQSPYRLAFTTEKGLWSPTTQPFEIPRYNINYWDQNPIRLMAKSLKNRILPAWFTFLPQAPGVPFQQQEKTPTSPAKTPERVA